MGLDTVELVMEIEDTFGITFPDAAAEHCRTVNEVALFVYGRIQASSAACVGINAGATRFQELRQAIAQYRKVSPHTLAPETPADVAIPREIRRAFWSRSEIRLPPLRRPEWARALIGFSVFGAFVLFFAIYAVFFVRANFDIFLYAALSVVPVFVVTLALRPWKCELAPEIQTVGDLANSTLAKRKKYEPLPSEPTFPDVVLRIRHITADQLGLPLEKVQPHSRFVEDLGAD